MVAYTIKFEKTIDGFVCDGARISDPVMEYEL